MMITSALIDVAVRRRHRARPDPLEQRRDARGVAQARAVVDVVGVEAGADQLLEEVGLLVGALGRPKAGDRPGSAVGVDLGEPPRDEVERLVPARLAERRHHLVVVDESAGLAPALRPSAGLVAADVHRQRPLRVGVLAPDQRLREPLRGGRVVPAVAALDAQPALGPGLRAALGERDRLALVVDVVGERAADAAVRAHRVDLPELLAGLDRYAADRLVGQRARSGTRPRTRRRSRTTTRPSGRSGRTRSGSCSPCRCGRSRRCPGCRRRRARSGRTGCRRRG